VGSYPENDFTARSGRSLEAVLSRERIDHDIKVYPGTGHSFFKDQGRAYDQEAADDSWQRVLKFFGSHLQTKK
jgi:carboxymethylenebutenolidase